MQEKQGVVEKSFKLRKRIPSSYFNASWSLWQSGKSVSIENLSSMLRAMKEDIDEDAAKDMVDIAEFLSAACPM